jgi:protein-S-isoprenylcysteine O-methyltransferase Ste14
VLAVGDTQPVIESGPYRWLRHPSYSGLLLAFAGCGVMVGDWAGLLGSVGIVLAALVFRIRVEERALTAALGQRYVTFASRRARLVPFVW